MIFYNNYLWNENRVFHSPWTVIFFHVIFTFLRDIIASTVRLNRWYTLRYWSFILDQRPSTRPRQPWERVLDSQHGGDKIGSRRWSTSVSTVLRKSDQIFFIVNVLLIKKNFPSWNLENGWTNASSEENGTGQYPVWMTKKHRKRDFREFKSKTFLWEHTPRPPRSFGACLGNRSVFILGIR